MGQEKNIPRFQGAWSADFQLVETADALENFARQAAKAEMVAVDLEADSMFHYQEKVCLIQMTANGLTAVIDPLKVSDITPLKPIFEDRQILKVFHGADYDVRSLYRDFGININHLFDTQLACMYLGRPTTSLESVVADRFGVELNKKYQKKDWSQRPLPTEMVAYAASDVIYLIPLARAMMAELEALGRLSWVVEGCQDLSRVRPAETNHTPMFLRCRGAGRLVPRQLAVLEELLKLRDLLARQKDRPHFKVLGNSTLLKIAVEMPDDEEELKQSRILTNKQLGIYGQWIVAAVEKGMNLPESRLPHYPRRKTPRLSHRIPPRAKALRDWRDQLAARMKLDPALLLNKALIRNIAVMRPLCVTDLDRVPNIRRWQIETFGEQIIAVLKALP